MIDAFAAVPQVVVTLVFVVVVFGIAYYRKVEQPGATPSRPGSAYGRWNGQILGTGGLATFGGTQGSTFGVFEVREGVMTFTPDGAPVPDWTASCHALVVARRNAENTLNGADVSLSWQEGPPESGWRTATCNVSEERFDRVIGLGFKMVRERGYATDFVKCLVANGARGNG